MQDAYSPTPKSANQTTVSAKSQATAAPAPISNCIFLEMLDLSSFPHLFSTVSVILKTLFDIFRVVPSSWNVIEVPSFYRGLVALWVIAGLILVIAYQSEVFVTTGVSTLSAVQPGSRFSSGLPTSSATTNVSLSIVLFQTPITCNQTEFTLEIVADATTSTGSLTGTPVCVQDSSLPSLNLTFEFPAPLSFTTTSTVSLVATSISGSPLFSHGVWYKILLENYDGTFTQVIETLTNDPTNQVTGDVSVSVSTVPTEYLDENQNTLKTGYTFSYFSSSAPAVAVPSSSTLQVAFDLSVPGYFYQVKQVQAISGLQFVVDIGSLAGGVMTVGSVIANAGSSFTNAVKTRKETPI